MKMLFCHSIILLIQIQYLMKAHKPLTSCSVVKEKKNLPKENLAEIEHLEYVYFLVLQFFFQISLLFVCSVPKIK